MSQFLDYLEGLQKKGASLPSSIAELPAPWPKWFKNLPSPREPLSPQEGAELSDRLHQMMVYASSLPEKSDEHRRAKANRLYYAALNCARTVFDAPLDEGHGSHQHFALYLLRAAIEEKTLTLDDLILLETGRRNTYLARIQADYQIAASFKEVNLGLLTIDASRLFNALVDLAEAESEK